MHSVSIGFCDFRSESTRLSIGFTVRRAASNLFGTATHPALASSARFGDDRTRPCESFTGRPSAALHVFANATHHSVDAGGCQRPTVRSCAPKPCHRTLFDQRREMKTDRKLMSWTDLDQSVTLIFFTFCRFSKFVKLPDCSDVFRASSLSTLAVAPMVAQMEALVSCRMTSCRRLATARRTRT